MFTPTQQTKKGTKGRKFIGEGNNKIIITTATISDIKRANVAASNGKKGSVLDSQKPRQLVRIPSKVQRQNLYEEAARAIEAREFEALPSHGDRPWRCSVKVIDTAPGSSAPEKGGTKGCKKKQCAGPLFRWFRGRLELACLPHIFEQITVMESEIPVIREHDGDGESDSEEEEEDWDTSATPATALRERRVSSLSSAAWNDPDHPIPTIERRWLSPDHKIFNRRKAVLEHAAELIRRDKFIDRILHGYGARGTKLRPFKPTRKDALEAGLYRFLRDGLWVVGQEEAWQESRAAQVSAKDRRQEKKKTVNNVVGVGCADIETAGTVGAGDGNGHTPNGETVDGGVLGKESSVAAFVSPGDSGDDASSFEDEGTQRQVVANSVSRSDLVALSPDGALTAVSAVTTSPSRTPPLSQPTLSPQSDPGPAINKVRNKQERLYPAKGDGSSNVGNIPLGVDGPRKSFNGSDPNGDENPPLAISKPAIAKTWSPPGPPRRITPSSHWRLNPKQIELCYNAAIEHYEKVMYTVKARALYAELSDGFDVFRERGRGRFDMELPAFDTPEFNFLTDLRKAPWMPIVKKILGEDVALIHKGVFLSLPGSEAQVYHQDGPHLTTKCQKPCHAVNVFVPLVDLHPRNGPTEFCLGTHILEYEYFAKEMVDLPLPPAGTPVVFDYRLGHRGMGNSSQHCRPIVYCTYAVAGGGKEFRDSVNFSRKRYRKIGHLVDKPLSREERAKRRKQGSE